jgi:hypothetical protein
MLLIYDSDEPLSRVYPVDTFNGRKIAFFYGIPPSPGYCANYYSRECTYKLSQALKAIHLTSRKTPR